MLLFLFAFLVLTIWRPHCFKHACQIDSLIVFMFPLGALLSSRISCWCLLYCHQQYSLRTPTSAHNNNTLEVAVELAPAAITASVSFQAMTIYLPFAPKIDGLNKQQTETNACLLQKIFATYYVSTITSFVAFADKFLRKKWLNQVESDFLVHTHSKHIMCSCLLFPLDMTLLLKCGHMCSQRTILPFSFSFSQRAAEGIRLCLSVKNNDHCSGETHFWR